MKMLKYPYLTEVFYLVRQIVIQLCNELAIEVLEKAISQKDVTTMDEAFLTGTRAQIAAIQQIDNHILYKDNEPVPITQKLQQAFSDLRNKQGYLYKMNDTL